jgi:hypothetical protein
MPFKIISDISNKYRETRNLRLLDQNNDWPIICDVTIHKDGKYEITMYPLGDKSIHFSKGNIEVVLEVDKIVKELPEIPVS